ncbi:S8 family peptidase [Marinibactrum halimedae]|uniref:S8 family peptidase n=1 Tax=Marinibactrum halimedae TaxID=1444977 RepID=A0AA37T3K4_9GAMM|nr:S8 family peptidase [Marinibactrum halimedae]MCD9457815.1 S8 family peptidase [Marinibactrum halimedae]GLS24811.1 hypothetical protein GCM10007877_05250 [Marinibactrum halimedae]
MKRLTKAIKNAYQSAPRTILLGGAIATSLISTSAAIATPAELIAAPIDTAIQGQYIVVFKDDYVQKQAGALQASSASPASMKELRKEAALKSVSELVNAYGVVAERSYSSALAGFAAKLDKSTLKALLKDERVEFIEQDQLVSLTTVQPNATWGLDRIDQEDLPLNSEYEYNYTGDGIDMYIIDTGILASHSDFGGRVSSGRDFVGDGRRATEDCNGHGTHVAGTAGGTTWGVAKEVDLIPVRVIGCGNSAPNSNIVSGVDYVAGQISGPSVVNMSLGGPASTATDRAVNSVINNGAVVVVAAGNSNSDACNGSPNGVPRALTIANSTRSDRRAGTSSWGRCIDMFAPGTSITSAWSNGGTRSISGTSMASPHVAGAAALYLEANPGSTVAQVESGLESVAARGKISDLRGSPNLLLQTNFGGGTTPPPPPPPPSNCGEGVISFGTMQTYSGGSDDEYEISSDGCSITVTGNSWVMTAEDYNITSGTSITFEFSASGTAEIQGVGFDADSGASSNRIFKLAGTQDWGIDDYSYSGGTQTITIPVGQFYTGNSMSFVIANDKDSGTLNNSVTVSNVRISN